MDNEPLFWIPALLATGLFEVGVQEMLAKRWPPALIFFAWSLMLFALAVSSAIKNWAQFIASVKEPSLVPFIIVAVIASLSLGLFQQYRRDSRVKESAEQLAASLERFENECVMRSLYALTGANPLVTPRPETQQMIDEEAAERKSFNTRYRPRIETLSREVKRYRMEIPNLLMDLDAKIPTRDVVFTASRMVRDWSEKLPQPSGWVNGRLILQIAIYGVLAALLWSGLHWVHHQHVPLAGSRQAHYDALRKISPP